MFKKIIIFTIILSYKNSMVKLILGVYFLNGIGEYILYKKH